MLNAVTPGSHETMTSPFTKFPEKACELLLAELFEILINIYYLKKSRIELRYQFHPLGKPQNIDEVSLSGEIELLQLVDNLSFGFFSLGFRGRQPKTQVDRIALDLEVKWFYSDPIFDHRVLAYVQLAKACALRASKI